LIFRLFDVIKPFPAGRLEHLPAGLGIMADDAMAGVYAHLVLRVGVMFGPAWFAA
jgi:phosphatidylglycerophosphatase A